MTDHPGATPPPSEESDGPDLPGDGSRAADAARTGTPPVEPDAPARGFDAAFEGPAWDAGRRRRRSSTAGGTQPASTPPDLSRPSSRRRSSSRSSGRSSADRASSGRRPRGNRRIRHARSVLVHLVLGLFGLGLAWIAVTGVLAALQLQQARTDLTTLRSAISDGTSSASLDTTARSLATHAHHAAVLTRGPAWAVAARVPFLGEPLESVRGITRETSRLVDAAAPGLVAVAGDVDPRTVVKGGAVDLTAVRTAAPAVHTAADATVAARTGVDALPRSTWLSPVDKATSTLRDQVDGLAATLRTTDQALQVLPTMLGGDGRTRRYFVAFQNNAELRGTGGLPGAFAIVAATDGRISIERFESDSVLTGVPSVGLDFGAAFDAQYAGDLAYTQYTNSNASPHFPYAAQIWCSMWQNATGQQLDGALTVDPGALSYLLAATGPATAPDGQQVTAANVVSLLQKDVYAQFPAAGENDDRKRYILDIAEAVEKKVVAGTGNSRTLLQGLSRAVDERRIVVWSRDPTAESVLAGAAIGGTVPTTDQPYSQLVLNNGAAGKLDYYLGRSVTVARAGCGDTRSVTVTIRLTNNAPASGLPPYVTERLGFAPPAGFVTGQNRTVVNYVATAGAGLLSATLDGQDSGAGVFEVQGHPSFQTIVEIKPGQTVTWVLNLQEPAGTQPVTVVKQPGVLPVDETVDDRSCS